MAAEALEQSMLESKDKEQLLAIAQALGIKTTSRAAKATLIDKILKAHRDNKTLATTDDMALSELAACEAFLRKVIAKAQS